MNSHADLGNLAHIRARIPVTASDVSPAGWRWWREGRWVEIYGPVDVRPGREPNAGSSLDPSNIKIKHATGAPVKAVKP